MSDRSDELLLIWLNPRIEKITGFGARHPQLTDLVIALLAAAASVAGLWFQNLVHVQQLAFCAGLSATLLLRSRSVVLAFCTTAAVAFVQWLVSTPQLADMAVLIALYWVTLEADLPAVVFAVVVAELGAVLVAAGWERSQAPKYWVALTGLLVAASALGIMIRQRRALLAQLQERADRLERERDQQGRLGAAAERARIAREMHDIVSHNLTVMIALADGASYALDSSPLRAKTAIERVSATGREALVEMRRLLGVLRDESAEQPLEPQPSLARLDDLIARVDEAGIKVTVELDGDPNELAPGVQLAVFRVAQEALTNTLKHAPKSATARLSLKCRPGQVDLDVVNSGGDGGEAGGAEHSTDGRGLRGMRERATAYGGELEIGPTDDGGWRVHLRLTPELTGVSR